jgi:hypothetical protein
MSNRFSVHLLIGWSLADEQLARKNEDGRGQDMSKFFTALLVMLLIISFDSKYLIC